MTRKAFTKLGGGIAFVIILLASFQSITSADSNTAYYAIYCSQQDSSLSMPAGHHALLDCNQSAQPAIEATVNSADTNPDGDHDVTIVQADCYPGTPTASLSAGHVGCSEGPNATLTLGKTFAASKPPSKSVPTPTPASMSSIAVGNLPQADASQDTLKTMLRIVFGIIGAFALLSITLSGFKYVTSAGNPQQIAEAKNGILFALAGLVIAISAEAIVTFLVDRAS